MTIYAYDSITPADIPANAEAIFPYADDLGAWSHTLFPHAYWRTITRIGDPACDIIDYEPGCVYNTGTLHNWANERRSKSLDVTVYCDRSNYPEVAEALKGIEWYLWLSTLDGSKPVRYMGKPLRAVQYTDRSNLYDESVVYDEAWIMVNKPS